MLRIMIPLFPSLWSLVIVWGETKSPVTAANTRCIQPFPGILRAVDVAVGCAMGTFRNNMFGCLVFYGGCAKKGRQSMDIAFCQAQVLEKALDSGSVGAVAHANIKQFYCRLRAQRVSAWLLEQGCNVGVCASFLRLPLWPSILLNVAGGFVEMVSRSVGVFPGCMSTVQAGRAPLFDACMSFAQPWSDKGLPFKCKAYDRFE